MAARSAYPLENGWLDDLKALVKGRRMTVTAAAAELGMSRATAYRLVSQAKTQGRW